MASGPDRRLVAAIARAQGSAGLRRKLARLEVRLRNLIGACDISPEARIAADTRLPHLTGVVIHEDTVIEAGCMIMQQVTLGQVATAGAPHLEKDVYVGAGAKVLGAVTLGRGARIGANAVVLSDVPAGATAVGVPARIVTRDAT